MAGQHEQQHSDPVVAAIERVLKTERDGVEMLRRSEDEARRLLTQARTQAAAVARRADRCISRLHTAYLQKIERDIQTLAASHAAPGAGTDKAYDTKALTQAARRAAAKLTGAP
jgi:vacuolar-type H+-ATPase subunit H